MINIAIERAFTAFTRLCENERAAIRFERSADLQRAGLTQTRYDHLHADRQAVRRGAHRQAQSGKVEIIDEAGEEAGRSVLVIFAEQWRGERRRWRQQRVEALEDQREGVDDSTAMFEQRVEPMRTEVATGENSPAHWPADKTRRSFRKMSVQAIGLRGHD